MFFWVFIILSKITSDTLAQSNGFNQACGIINSLPCDQVTQTPVCGSDSVLYPSECDFAKAQCQNTGLSADASKCITVSPNTTPLFNSSKLSTPSSNSSSIVTTSAMNESTTAVSNLSTVLTLVPTQTTMTQFNMTNTTSSTDEVTGNPTPTNVTDQVNALSTESPNMTTSNENTTMLESTILTLVPTQTTMAAEVNITTTTPLPTDGLSLLCRIVVATACPPPTPDDKPVCATNNTEFPTLCEFSHAQCFNPGLSIVHGGPCLTTTRAPTVEELICIAILLNPCADDGVVLCGSDGVTYSNSCEFEKEKCVNHDLQIASRGQCQQ